MKFDLADSSLKVYKRPSWKPASIITSNIQVYIEKMINKAKLWHLRLGHMPIHRLRMLFPDLDEKLIKSSFFCTVCFKTRQTRTSFPKSVSKTTKPLDLLHVDIWGPLKHCTRTQCNSFVALVDDFSRMCWIYLVENKSDFPSVLKKFVVYIEKQLGTKVKCIRTNNAMELVKGEACNFYKSCGILNQSRCAYTHPTKWGGGTQT